MKEQDVGQQWLVSLSAATFGRKRQAPLLLCVRFAASRCVFVYLRFGGGGGGGCVWEDEEMKGSVEVRATVPGYQVYCLEELQHD